MAKKPVKKKGAVEREKERAVRKVERAETAGMTASDVMAAVNTSFKSPVVRPAQDLATDYLLRRPTGITSLDIEMAGGFAAASSSVLVGPDGAGKDLLLWMTCAETQRIYGEDFRMLAVLTEFRADKPFMRDVCGLKIGFSDEELDSFDAARERSGLPKLTDEEREERKSQVGEIYLIEGEVAETAFDAVIEFVRSNTLQIIVINSIGFLQTEAKEAVETFSEFPQQRNEAMLLTKFMPKLAMTLNNDKHGRNETSLLIVNQVRSMDGASAPRGRPVMDRDKYESGSKAWALKHGKAIELMIHKGAKHRDVTDNRVVGRKVPWELTKGKLGTHDGKSGEFDFFYDGGVDLVGDLYNTCIRYGVFEQAGAWISYDHEDHGFRVMGIAGARRKIMESKELYDLLRAECFKKAGVICRFR